MIQSVERAMVLLQLVAESSDGGRLSDLADRAGLKRSTAHNLLATLEQLGYVAQLSHGGRYILTSLLAEISRGSITDDGALREEFHSVLERIVGEFGETCYLAVPSGASYVCLDVVEARASLRLTVAVGEREPLVGTAIGHALLTDQGLASKTVGAAAEGEREFLRRSIESVRREGLALDLSEYRSDISCVAVPLERAGVVMAAIGLAGPASRLPESKLRDAAAFISTAIPPEYRRSPLPPKRQAR